MTRTIHRVRLLAAVALLAAAALPAAHDAFSGPAPPPAGAAATGYVVTVANDYPTASINAYVWVLCAFVS
jgi:hypothetical protein